MTTIVDDNANHTGGIEDERVLVRANNVFADGDGGDDWLSAQLYLRAQDWPDLSSSLFGGAGRDHLMLSVDTGWPIDVEAPRTLSASLDGGDGDDTIWAELASNADQEISADGGGGDDRIDVTSDTPRDGDAMHRVDSAVNGGDGSDHISVFLNEGDILDVVGGSGSGVLSTIHGSDGADIINSDVSAWSGGAAENFLYGGDGNDEIVAKAATGFEWSSGAAYNRARGGEGDDRIELEAWAEGALVTSSAMGDAGDDVISVVGSTPYGDVHNDISGGSGDDTLTARSHTGGWDEDPGSAVNTINGDAGDDRITGTATISGELWEGNYLYSDLYGGAGDDIISARGGFDNILAGNQGDDTLRGSGSTDRLIGGQGADVLRGGGGEDEFVFKGTRGEASERDRVADFSQGEDRFDLSAIDANVFRGGNQAFTFDGGTGTGRAWVEEDPNGSGSLLHADNGRGILVVSIRDGGGMDASDYEASDFLL